jgi:hypothetical protein
MLQLQDIANGIVLVRLRVSSALSFTAIKHD